MTVADGAHRFKHCDIAIDVSLVFAAKPGGEVGTHVIKGLKRHVVEAAHQQSGTCLAQGAPSDRSADSADAVAFNNQADIDAVTAGRVGNAGTMCGVFKRRCIARRARKDKDTVLIDLLHALRLAGPLGSGQCAVMSG